MPSCYLLAVCGGSSLDQHSNNVTLFNLVEQINDGDGESAVRTIEAHLRSSLAQSLRTFQAPKISEGKTIDSENL